MHKYVLARDANYISIQCLIYKFCYIFYMYQMKQEARWKTSTLARNLSHSVIVICVPLK